MKENTLMTQKASCIDENIGMTYWLMVYEILEIFKNTDC